MKSFFLCLAILISATAQADTRSASTIREFRKTHACPTTGKIQTTCPGYVIDHIVPLCAGGPDAVTNMMWQKKEDSYKKDAMERQICRRLATCPAK